MLQPVTLDQLRILIAIARSGSFSAAARQLGRAQSAISHAVLTLEASLDLALFDRRGRVPRLTEAGRTLLADAEAVVGRADELRARARSIAGGIEAELSLAVDVMFPPAVLIGSLRALKEAFPLLAITLHTEGLGVVETRVREGAARLGISPNYDASPDDGLDRRFLTEITLVSVVAADHPLARWPGPVPRGELERHVQLVLSDRSWLVARAQGRPVSPTLRGVVSPHAWRFVDLATRRAFLIAGLGFCNMPLHMVEGDLAAGRLKRIEVEGWGPPAYKLALHLVLERGREPGPAACWLIRFMEAHFQDIAPAPKPKNDAGRTHRRMVSE
jgi:DNA-binding transcriptional LysR family regulator